MRRPESSQVIPHTILRILRLPIHTLTDTLTSIQIAQLKEAVARALSTTHKDISPLDKDGVLGPGIENHQLRRSTYTRRHEQEAFVSVCAAVRNEHAGRAEAFEAPVCVFVVRWDALGSW